MSSDLFILVIDDNQDDRDLSMIMLNRAGYRNVISAKSGEEGLDVARDQKPDIVIADTNLPGINGVETCRRIKAIDGYSPKVIVMTGQIDSVDAAKARDAGADDYVVKTSEWKELLSAVQQIV